MSRLTEGSSKSNQKELDYNAKLKGKPPYKNKMKEIDVMFDEFKEKISKEIDWELAMDNFIEKYEYEKNYYI